jgi:hypothetical protein
MGLWIFFVASCRWIFEADDFFKENDVVQI